MYNATKLGALAKLTFQEKGHRYSYNGARVPNVTSIVDSLLPFRGAPASLMEEARFRGTRVHEITAAIDSGEDPRLSRKDKTFLPYLEAWLLFRSDCRFTPLAIEERVFHRKHRFAGTLDRIGYINGGLSVVDLKTGALYPEYALQTAAYKEAANDGRQGEKIQGRWAVQLTDKGTYVLTPYTDKADFSVFLAAMTLNNWKARIGRG